MKRLKATITPETLKEIRLFLRVQSLREMADLLGVSLNTYTNWELGRRPIPLWLQKFLTVIVKNVEMIEVGMVVRNYVGKFLKEPKVAERLREYYPRFNLEHVVNFPMLDFLFKTFSAIPFSNIEGRLEDFLAGKLIQHPTKMREILENDSSHN